MADSSKEKKYRLRIGSFGRSKAKGKPGKDPPEVTHSSASALPQDKQNTKQTSSASALPQDKQNTKQTSSASALPQDKQNTKQTSKQSKKEKKQSSSSRSLKTSIESPASGLNRDSYILESAATASSSTVGEDKVQHGSPPSGGESALIENSSEATYGELFHDDPQRVKYGTEDEVKSKPLDEHSPQNQLHQIELQLQEKEKEFHQESKSKSVTERLHALLHCYEKRIESERTEVSNAHEKARRGMVKELKELETRMSEAKKTHNEALTKIKDKSQALEQKWREERENMMSEQVSLKKKAENADKCHQEEKGKLNSDLGDLRSSMERLESQMKEKEDEFRQVVEQHQQDRQQLQSKSKELEEMKEEVRGKVREKEQLVMEKEKENCKLRDEVAELKNKCDDQQAKITNLEKAKQKGQERMIKSYEGKMSKLQQQLQSQMKEEEKLQATTATAGNEEGLRMELKKGEEELEELKQQLKRAEENLQEEEAKREVDMKEKNDLQQQLQARQQLLEEEARKSKTMEQKFLETEVKLEEQKAKAEVHLKEKEKQLEDLQHQLVTVQEQVQKQEAGREEKLKELEQQLRTTQEQKERELQQQLQATREQLEEQEIKREESQQKLESIQKAMKAAESSSTTKSAKDLDTYFDIVTKLCEEMTDWKKKAEDQQKESEKLQKLMKRAEELEEANFEAGKKLSEAEANIEALRAQIPATVVAEGGEQTLGSGATRQPLDTQSTSSVTELKQKVQELADKLQARDEELHSLKSKQGDTPLTTPASPTDSVAADSGEVQSLKRKLKEKEIELQNLQVQVTSTAQLLEERDKLRKTLTSLKSEVAKLTHEKKTISDYSKQQSERVMKLKTESETLQKALQESSDATHTHEVEDWKARTETAYQALESMKAQVEKLTTELYESRQECKRKEAAFDVSNEQAQKLQQKLNEEVKSLKEKAEQMKVKFVAIHKENKNLKQDVSDMKKEKESAVTDATAVHKEVERLREEMQQKDNIHQQSAEDQEQLKAELSAARAKCKDLEDCNKDVLGSQEQAMKDKDKEIGKLSEEVDKLKEEMKKMKEEVQVKTAQVTQYKKQLQGKHPTADSEQVQELQLLLATSRSSLDETQKELNALSHKHREMEKQYDKKFQEKESQLQQMKAENQRLEKECEMRQILAEKQKELQQSQAQIQQAEMANELTRLQRARNREDEFSKAFQEEFAAHHAMKARYAELQNQLDSVLDSLDGMRQKQEVLIHTLVEHGVELPFVEPQPMPPTNMAQATTETLQWGTKPSAHVAISQKPIASPGVYNQGRDQVSYMPPHSNAESQYQEQQAEQRVNNWQHQQQMQQQQQQHAYQLTGMKRTAPSISPQPQAAFGVPSCQQQAATFERDAVVGLPVSAVSRLIAPRTQQPSHTSQWPLQSRYSDSEIQSGQPRGNYPLSPRRVHNPNVAPPNMQSAMGPGGQNQPQNVGHPQLQPGQRGHSQPNVYAGYPQQGESQPPNVDMGRQPLQPNASAVDVTNRAEHPCHNVAQQPHMGQPHPHNMNYPGPQGNQLQHPQVNLPPQPYEAAVYQGGQMPPQSNAEPQYLEQQQRASNWQQQPIPGASPYHHQVDVTATNAQAPSCSHLPMITAQSDQVQQLPPPAPQQPPYNTPQLPPEQQVAPLPATHGSQYAQAEFVTPEPETAPPYPAAHPAGSEQKKPSKPEAGTVPPRKESDANEDEQVLMKNLSGAIKETFQEVNQDEQPLSISSGLQSIPPDPNLECVLCGKVFKIGQIQNFKRHSETCTGSQK